MQLHVSKTIGLTVIAALAGKMASIFIRAGEETDIPEPRATGFLVGEALSVSAWTRMTHGHFFVPIAQTPNPVLPAPSHFCRIRTRF